MTFIRSRPITHGEKSVEGQSAHPAPSTRLDRIARRTYIAGGLAFIFIGVMHTITQFTTLSSSTVKAQYRAGGDIDVSGELVDGWHLFAGTSLLMGAFSIAIGAITLAALREVGRPPVLVCVVNMITVASVAGVGYVHLSWLQLYGGIAGIVLFGFPLLRRWFSADSATEL